MRRSRRPRMALRCRYFRRRRRCRPWRLIRPLRHWPRWLPNRRPLCWPPWPPSRLQRRWPLRLWRQRCCRRCQWTWPRRSLSLRADRNERASSLTRCANSPSRESSRCPMAAQQIDNTGPACRDNRAVQMRHGNSTIAQQGSHPDCRSVVLGIEPVHHFISRKRRRDDSALPTDHEDNGKRRYRSRLLCWGNSRGRRQPGPVRRPAL